MPRKAKKLKKIIEKKNCKYPLSDSGKNKFENGK